MPAAKCGCLKKEARVHVIYVGGTIGMIRNESGGGYINGSCPCTNQLFLISTAHRAQGAGSAASRVSQLPRQELHQQG